MEPVAVAIALFLNHQMALDSRGDFASYWVDDKARKFREDPNSSLVMHNFFSGLELSDEKPQVNCDSSHLCTMTQSGFKYSIPGKITMEFRYSQSESKLTNLKWSKYK